MEDGEIVRLFLARDEAAIAATKAKYGAVSFGVALNILGIREDAEETVDDAYLSLWNAIPPHRPEKLMPFFLKLVRRAALKRRRDGRAKKRGGGEYALAYDELGDVASALPDPQSELERAELGAAIDRFLDTLPREARQLFVCRYWYMDSVPEISRRFGFSESKVKSSLMRSRRKLAAALKKEGYFIEH